MREKFNYHMSNKTPYDMAKYKVEQIKRFYIHFMLFLIATIIYVAKTYFGAPLNFSPFNLLSQTVMLIWAFIIVVKAVKTYSSQLFFGKQWEEKKMQKFMQDESTSKWE
jgi:uncharacterized membrane protein